MDELDRVGDWERFSAQVKHHIITYTIKQYQTPEGNDQAQSFTADDCIESIRRYINRFRKGARGFAEQIRDMYKIAHYAQFAHDKLIEEEKEKKENIYKEPTISKSEIEDVKSIFLNAKPSLSYEVLDGSHSIYTFSEKAFEDLKIMVDKLIEAAQDKIDSC